MVTRVFTLALEGIKAVNVDVQVQIAPGMPSFTIVGLADKAVGESRERVRSALLSSGLSLPPKRITVNLAPADLPKEGSHYDLPIALGLMAAMGALPSDMLSHFVVMGELCLDGHLASISGVLPAAMHANEQNKGFICPHLSGSEAAWAGEDFALLAPQSLLALVNHFQGHQVLSRPQPRLRELSDSLPDLADIRGQESAKRALEITAAGGHNMLMVGPPGAGKSMLASRLPGILPPLTAHELLDISMIQSLVGEINEGMLSDRRPFRAPHHSASMAALVGGGLKARPGEVSLAHNGVLFLDEFPEFSPQVLDGLRQPLEAKEAVIARANHRVSYPSNFQLIAAMNPCRCGRYGEPGHVCKRGERCVNDYQARISGPLLDRLDIRMDVPAVSPIDLIHAKPSEPSSAVKARVIAARERQQMRFAACKGETYLTNATCSTRMLEEIAKPDNAGLNLLEDAIHKFKLSARSYHRILRVSRTIADLDHRDLVTRNDIAEALSYRSHHSALQQMVA